MRQNVVTVNDKMQRGYRYVKEEPGIGKLMPGHTAIVDDHDPMCKRGEIKVVTGGDVTKVPIVYRTKKCVPRDQLP